MCPTDPGHASHKKQENHRSRVLPQISSCIAYLVFLCAKLVLRVGGDAMTHAEVSCEVQVLVAENGWRSVACMAACGEDNCMHDMWAGGCRSDR